MPALMKCSVIVANYNNAAVITQALLSVEQQTYTNWEVIIVDDGSTDDSLNVIDTYLAAVSDKAKYTIVALNHNQGEPAAKHAGICKATGDIIAICDPDDALHPEALDKVVNIHLQNPAASIVFTNQYRCDHLLNPMQTGTQAAPVRFSELLEDRISHLVSFKINAYNETTGFDPTLKLASDKDLYYKLEEVGKIVYIDEPLYYYRIWPKGVSQGFNGFITSRDYKLVAIENAMKRRKVSGVKMPTKREIKKLMAEVHLLQAEGLVYSDQSLGLKFIKHLGLSIAFEPFGSIMRKFKTALLLSRLKRLLLKRAKL
jgi:glycosyltransferase involved in cell wall biosynthesis